MPEQIPDPWLEFTFDGPAQASIDARSVGQVLIEVIAAARQIAADMLQKSEPRGPMSVQERALAAFTLKSVGPGSILRIEFAPPVEEAVTQITLGEAVTPLPTADQVIGQLELDLLGLENGEVPHRPSRRKSIADLKRSLIGIGPSVAIAGTYSGEFRRTPVYQRQPKQAPMKETLERRVYFGKATMADSDPGRPRLRASLYDGRRFLLDVADDFPTPLAEVFDRDVEFRVLDTVDAGVIVKSVVDAVRPLEPAEAGIDFPPKDWRRLAAEQGIDLIAPPDYVSLLRQLVDSDSEVEAFIKHIVASRGGYEPDD